MARESTFPADDVPDRSDEVMDVLRRHDPVPVPVTTLYLMVADKRALAGQFQRLEQEGAIERATLRPGEPQYADVAALQGTGEKGPAGPIGVYRLPRSPPTEAAGAQGS